MASSEYWDYYRWSTQGTQSTASSSPYNFGNFLDTSACSSYPSGSIIYKERKILVTTPDSWSEDQNLKFVELVNYKTNTGWQVVMVIKNGDILITDPDVERRTMAEFVPLLYKRASFLDAEMITKFFEKNKV